MNQHHDTFPIHSSDHKHGITSVPWAIVAPHEAQALRNHGQSLLRLAERGGLGLVELALVLCDRGLDGEFSISKPESWWEKTTADALTLIRAEVERYERERLSGKGYVP